MNIKKNLFISLCNDHFSWNHCNVVLKHERKKHTHTQTYPDDSESQGTFAIYFLSGKKHQWFLHFFF